MVDELRPYELVNLYRESRHSRANSWVFSTLAAGAAIAGFISCFASNIPHSKAAALGLFGASLVFTRQASHTTAQAERYQRRWEVLEEAAEDAQLTAIVRSVQPGLAPIKLTTAPEMELYDWANAPDEGVGFIIAGNSGSGKSSVATWLAGLLTQMEPAQCLVLDPHHNDLWQQQGLTSIGDIEEIEATIRALLKELDDRCTRKGNGKPLGDPLLIISDEIGACLERFKHPKWIQSALKRLGSEGRKFGMTLIAINQSQNADDLGISGSLRNNYVLILLGAAARKHARQLGKEFEAYLKGIAYPCMVSGASEDAIATHPTHGSYTQFKKQGNPPRNLIPIRQLPLTFGVDAKPPTLEQFADELPISTNTEHLEKCLKLPEVEDKIDQLLAEIDLSDIPKELYPIVQFSQGRDWVKAIDVKRNISSFKSISTSQIREYFLMLETWGCGETKGEGDFLQYRAIRQ